VKLTFDAPHNVVASQGCTPLALALQQGNQSCAEALLDAGSQLDLVPALIPLPDWALQVEICEWVSGRCANAATKRGPRQVTANAKESHQLPGQSSHQLHPEQEARQLELARIQAARAEQARVAAAQASEEERLQRLRDEADFAQQQQQQQRRGQEVLRAELARLEAARAEQNRVAAAQAVEQERLQRLRQESFAADLEHKQQLAKLEATRAEQSRVARALANEQARLERLDIAKQEASQQRTDAWKAIERDDVQALQQLLGSSNMIALRDELGRTALLVSALLGRTACVKVLLAARADVTVADNGGCTALHLAASHGKLDCLRALIAAHAPLNSRAKVGDTALHAAAQRGQVEFFAFSCKPFITHVTKSPPGGMRQGFARCGR
jgi:ankyrin repeat protein